MRDTWGPPDTGWPSFDEEGKRVAEESERECWCGFGATGERGDVARIDMVCLEHDV